MGKEIKHAFPVAYAADDYHEFSLVVETLESILKTKVKYTEIGFYDGSYRALFYLKKDKKYKEMLEEHKALYLDYRNGEPD